MFGFIKKVVILVLMSTTNLFVLTNTPTKCISLKNQECKIKKVIVDNKYMAYPYKIEVNKCVGSCNNISNPHAKVFIPDIVKNVTVKMFDLINLENTAKQVEFHESCKCVFKINNSVCGEKQKFSKNKCRCECLINKKCQNDFIWNYSNCECEYRKALKLISEECEEINDNITQNKTILTKYVENCKPFVASSILFLSVSIILTGIMIYFLCKIKTS